MEVPNPRILSYARKITGDGAFDLLRRTSQELNLKLRDVADRVVNTGTRPTAPSACAATPTPGHRAPATARTHPTASSRCSSAVGALDATLVSGWDSCTSRSGPRDLSGPARTPYRGRTPTPEGACHAEPPPQGREQRRCRRGARPVEQGRRPDHARVREAGP
ncbi:MAG: ANTAR domain-containing protein [Acidimicrobiia bacterium]